MFGRMNMSLELKKFDMKYESPRNINQYQFPFINPSILFPRRKGVARIDNSVINMKK